MSVTELYSDRDLVRLARKTRIWIWALCLFGAAALGTCIALASLATTGNAGRMELLTVAVSTGAGWIVIYCAVFVVTASRRELGHARMLRAEPDRERLAGQITVTAERLRIKKSIRIRPVEVRTGEGTRRVLVCESRARLLERAKPTALYLANGYVAAYEVEP